MMSIAGPFGLLIKICCDIFAPNVNFAGVYKNGVIRNNIEETAFKIAKNANKNSMPLAKNANVVLKAYLRIRLFYIWPHTQTQPVVFGK